MMKKTKRRFAEWDILELESCPIWQSDGTYIYAMVSNRLDPRGQTIYDAEVTRKINTVRGFRIEHIAGETFDDLIDALLYLESVDLSDYEITNE